MSDTGPPYFLPLLESAQSEPEVPVNEAMFIINANLGGGSSDSSDSGTGLPPGGSTGQVLTKASDADGDADWEDSTGGGGSDTGGGNVSPDSHPLAPNSLDDEFEGTSLDSKWTWGNQSTTTATLGQGYCTLIPPIADSDMHTIEQSAPSGTWKIRAKMHILNTANYNGAGLLLRESSTGKCVTYAISHSVTNADYQVTAFASYLGSSFSSTLVNGASGQTSVLAPGGITPSGLSDWDKFYLELENTGSLYVFRLSLSGINGHFITVHSGALTEYFTTAADKIGLVAVSQNSSYAPIASFDWFRRIS